MVNVLKRMRGLQPLYAIRHGEGAAILPPPPNPQLTSLNLRYQRRQWNKSTRPARTFHQENLPRFKYHNPALPITIEDTDKAPELTLTFESSESASLDRLEAEALLKSDEGDYMQSWSAIEQKPQTSQNSTSSPSTSARSIYTRNVILNLREHQTRSIWQWLQTATKCEDFPESTEEVEQRDRLKTFFAQAEVDRQRVKAGMDAIRKQREELKRARDAAAKMASDD